MKAETALARLAGGSPFGPRGPGGIPAVSADEIRGALGGLTDLQRHLVMLKWLQDRSSYRPAMREALVMLSDDERIIAWQHQPKGHPKGLLQAFIAVAIAEVCTAPICPVCRGTALRRGKACRSCEEGKRPMVPAELAGIASAYRKMGRNTWIRLAREYGYKHVWDRLSEECSIGVRKVQKQLVDP